MDNCKYDAPLLFFSDSSLSLLWFSGKEGICLLEAFVYTTTEFFLSVLNVEPHVPLLSLRMPGEEVSVALIVQSALSAVSIDGRPRESHRPEDASWWRNLAGKWKLICMTSQLLGWDLIFRSMPISPSISTRKSSSNAPGVQVFFPRDTWYAALTAGESVHRGNPKVLIRTLFKPIWRNTAHTWSLCRQRPARILPQSLHRTAGKREIFIFSQKRSRRQWMDNTVALLWLVTCWTDYHWWAHQPGNVAFIPLFPLTVCYWLVKIQRPFSAITSLHQPDRALLGP